MNDEQCSHRDAYFQEELDSLKFNMARITSLLKHKHLQKSLVKVHLICAWPLLKLKLQHYSKKG
jgi:hypothetical protein